ncbi:enoyl-CoA hydratase/isomerase family protein [Herbiconiux sp. P17]|uniref:enoyl-CoA hydratase/isomerase family protein n=1 Tax=Herbiconiux wuyangfengii TaxID=3342794 RepID=UPI0035B6EE32
MSTTEDQSRACVTLEVQDGVGTITLARPPMNAFNAEMMSQLKAAADAAGSREDVRAVVVTGSERVFAAGADIVEMAGFGYAEMARLALSRSDQIGAIAAIPKPTIAAIAGYALGGGLELALACDVRFCSTRSRLGQPEILLGIIPGAGGTQRLTRLIGPSGAKDLIFTGRMVEAPEALALGLVDRIVEGDAVLDEALGWARQFAEGPALALAAAKKAIDAALNVDLRTGLILEAELSAGLFGSSDQQTGTRSFIDNGPGKASFSGR